MNLILKLESSFLSSMNALRVYASRHFVATSDDQSLHRHVPKQLNFFILSMDVLLCVNSTSRKSSILREIIKNFVFSINVKTHVVTVLSDKIKKILQDFILSTIKTV